MVALCSVCQRTASCYTCPHCEVVYCSLDCYKRHDDKCTEKFYKTQVEQELRSQRCHGTERRRLEQIVAELSSLDASQNQNGSDIDSDSEREEEVQAERWISLAEKAEVGQLKDMDLTEEELKRFHSELKRGILGNCVEVWNPWWQQAQIMDSASLLPTPSHICCSSSCSANPAVAYSVLEVLYAYTHVMRAFNGDWNWDALQAAVHLIHLAGVICQHRVHETVAGCFVTLLSAATTIPSGSFGLAFDTHCLLDVLYVLQQGKDVVLRVIHEANNMLNSAIEDAKAQDRKNCRRLTLGSKKLAFLTSFAYYHSDLLEALLVEVQSFAEEREASLQHEQDAKGRRTHDGVAIPAR